MQTSRPVKILAIVTGLFFFTSNLSGSFLPLYFRDLGLGVPQIAEILLFTFMVLGLLPLLLLKAVKNFERIITVGIFTTMLFFVILIFVKDPIILGLTRGLSLATFWPSFNLLQFRLTESKQRARFIGLFSIILPSLASIFGPATGGFIIQNFGFASLFITSMILYLIAFILSTQVHFESEVHRFAIPRSGIFIVFFLTFIIIGLIENYWLAYPFFLYGISGTALNMGLVLAASAVLISAITFSVSWLSDVRRIRVEFAVVGTALNVVWYVLVTFSRSMNEIVALSLLSGVASAFQISWFAHYADSFDKEYYASILVMMETGLMAGRIMNLLPTVTYISEALYPNYFMLLGAIALCLIPLYALSKRVSPNVSEREHA